MSLRDAMWRLLRPHEHGELTADDYSLLVAQAERSARLAVARSGTSDVRVSERGQGWGSAMPATEDLAADCIFRLVRAANTSRTLDLPASDVQAAAFIKTIVRNRCSEILSRKEAQSVLLHVANESEHDTAAAARDPFADETPLHDDGSAFERIAPPAPVWGERLPRSAECVPAYIEPLVMDERANIGLLGELSNAEAGQMHPSPDGVEAVPMISALSMGFHLRLAHTNSLRPGARSDANASLARYLGYCVVRVCDGLRWQEIDESEVAAGTKAGTLQKRRFDATARLIQTASVLAASDPTRDVATTRWRLWIELVVQGQEETDGGPIRTQL